MDTMSSKIPDNDHRAFSVDNHWTGAEPFLVGIAPNFWAHVPMTISGVNDLKLVNGIHCWASADGNYHVPISKCELVGCVVNATVRSSDESILYVLDDGTGLIDCLVWANNTENDIFHLPSLTLNHHSDKIESKDIGLGDIVRVFGKIQCVTIQGEHDNQNETFVVREIQASLVERVDGPNDEARHWNACAEREELMARDPTQFNALGYLKLLGPQITAQVKARQHLPAMDDMLGEWRIFGTSCTCDLDYKANLLYCHCLAKVEPLDPQFIFRDALLNHLLGVQATHAKKLVFPYKGIKINPKLRAVASRVLSTSNTKEAEPESNMKILVDRILLNTFRALRNDGILHLANMNSDQYLLISRKWVLEPYVRRELEISRNGGSSKNFINFEGAPYLSQVHRDRLLYIKRSIVEGESEMGQTAK
jgi:hypothetical protein